MKRKQTINYYAELAEKTVLLGQTSSKVGVDEDDQFPTFLIDNLQVINQSIEENYLFTIDNSSIESTLKTLMFLIDLGMKIFATDTSNSTPTNLIYCRNSQEVDDFKKVYFGREATLKLFGIDFIPFT